MNLDILIDLVEKIANKKTDGHLTILKFTKGWKIFLGTPNLDIVEERDNIAKLESFPTLKETLKNFIANPVSIYDVDTDLDDIFSDDGNDMVDIYNGLSNDDGEDVYLSDGVWLGSDGSMDDRGR